MNVRTETQTDTASEAVDRALEAESHRRRPLGWIVFALALVAIVAFVATNGHTVRVDWYGTSGETALWALLAITALAGAILTELGRVSLRSSWRRRKERRANSRHARDSVRRLERRRGR